MVGGLDRVFLTGIFVVVLIGVVLTRLHFAGSLCRCVFILPTEQNTQTNFPHTRHECLLVSHLHNVGSETLAIRVSDSSKLSFYQIISLFCVFYIKFMDTLLTQLQQ